jgi:membrane protein
MGGDPVRRLFSKNYWFRFWLTLVRPLERSLIRLDEMSGGLIGGLYQAVYRFTRYGPHEAAALSYYTLFSLFPLLLLAIVFSASLLGTEDTRDQVSNVFSLFFPGDAALILDDAIAAALDERGSVSIIAFILLAWSSSSLFGNLEAVLSRTFGVVSTRRIYERRMVGLLMISTFLIFLLASVVTNLLFSFLDLLYLNQFNTWLRMASLFVPTAFNAAIFAMLYGFLPHRAKLRWDAILPSALLGGLAFELAKRVFVYYLSNLSSLNYVYGSVTTVVVFMLWAYYISCLVLICAEICVALNDWLGPQLKSLREESQAPMLVISGQVYSPRLNPPGQDTSQ